VERRDKRAKSKFGRHDFISGIGNLKNDEHLTCAPRLIFDDKHCDPIQTSTRQFWLNLMSKAFVQHRDIVIATPLRSSFGREG
jgi:hypothetical protein